MKNKYVMISGFAFSEKGDMRKLKNYAKEGWILEGISAGFFYKLKKDKPRNLEYSLDYQSEADDEYFHLFLEAGWKPVVSLEGDVHIFEAEAGTKPIYSDQESIVDKYRRIKKQTGRGSIYSLIIMGLFIALSIISGIFIKPIFLITIALSIVSMCIFIFNFMPYLAYNYRIREFEKTGKCEEGDIFNKSSWIMWGAIGIAFGIWGVMDVLKKKYLGIAGIIIGILYIIMALKDYKRKP